MTVDFRLGLQPEDMAAGYLDRVAGCKGLVEDMHRQVIDREDARNFGHDLEQIFDRHFRGQHRQLIVVDESTQHERAGEDLARGQSRRALLIERGPLGLGCQCQAELKQQFGQHRIGIGMIVELNLCADPRPDWSEHDDILDVLAQGAMRGVAIEYPAPYFMGIGAMVVTTGIEFRNQHGDAVEARYRMRPGRRCHGKPGIADMRHPIDDQPPKVVDCDRIDRHDGARRIQRLAPQRDPTGARRTEQFLDWKVGTIGQLGQGIAELLQDGDAGIGPVVVGPKLARQTLDECRTLSQQGGIVEPAILAPGRQRHGTGSAGGHAPIRLAPLPTRGSAGSAFDWVLPVRQCEVADVR